MAASDAQAKRLMAELEKHGQIGKAALRAGMDRKTARKYRDLGKLPSELKKPRQWKTRKDPFAEDWPYLEDMLTDAPELEAQALFEHLDKLHPGRYQEGQVRTLQRRLKRWRALVGPPKEVFFPQQHRAGEAIQIDFTHASKLGITIQGEALEHMLCHCVLPYSNWQHATLCYSESIQSLQRGLQSAIFRLGRAPEFAQTDNSTAATHRDRAKDGSFVGWEEGPREGRKFNEEYLAIVAHYGMKARTTGVGKKEQNGDVEALNGALKRRLKQHLLLRGSRDFESTDAYEAWLRAVLDQANRRREKRLQQDLAAMKPLRASRLAESRELRVKVGRQSTIRVKKNTYSVPARLIGEEVRVRLYHDRLEVYLAGTLQLETRRLLGKGGASVEYRHLIDSLVRKPGAFPRYRHREAFFPSVTFRRAHDALHAALPVWQADQQYLRALNLAAKTLESEVETALDLLLGEGVLPRFREVEPLVRRERLEVPKQEPLKPDLASYDALLEGAA